MSKKNKNQAPQSLWEYWEHADIPVIAIFVVMIIAAFIIIPVALTDAQPVKATTTSTK